MQGSESGSVDPAVPPPPPPPQQAMPQLQPGEVRELGITFDPLLAKSFTKARDLWAQGRKVTSTDTSSQPSKKDSKKEANIWRLSNQIVVADHPLLDKTDAAGEPLKTKVHRNLVKFLGLDKDKEAPLPEDIPVQGVRVGVVPADDPRVGLRGGKGLYAACRLQPGFIVGIYRSYAHMYDSHRRLVRRPPDSWTQTGAEWELNVESYCFCDKEGGYVDPVSETQAEIFSDGVGAYQNETAFVNDPTVFPTGGGGGNEEAFFDREEVLEDLKQLDQWARVQRGANCSIFVVIIRGWPFLAMAVHKEVELDEELLYEYGLGFWEEFATQMHRVRTQQKELRSMQAATAQALAPQAPQAPQNYVAPAAAPPPAASPSPATAAAPSPAAAPSRAAPPSPAAATTAEIGCNAGRAAGGGGNDTPRFGMPPGAGPSTSPPAARDAGGGIADRGKGNRAGGSDGRGGVAGSAEASVEDDRMEVDSAADDNLAHCSPAQGRDTEVESVYRQVLEANIRELGPDHPDTIDSTYKLAVCIDAQGHHSEAEAMYRQVLKARTRELGPDHPDTILFTYVLAGCISAQDHLTEAEAMYRQALEARTRELGPDHPDTITAFFVLACCISAQLRQKEAEPMFRQALQARARVLGLDHKNTINSIRMQAGCISALGRFTEAERMFCQALEASTRVLGLDHPDTIPLMRGLARCSRAQGRHPEADAMYRKAQELQDLEASTRGLSLK